MFTLPDGYIPKLAAKVMSLQDPTKKMSKSDDNPKAFVAILDKPETIIKKFKSAVTDSETQVAYREGKDGINNLMSIYSAVTGKTFQVIEDEFAGKGYGEFKLAVGEAVAETLRPVRERFDAYMKEKAYLEDCYRKGAEKAQALSQRTLDKVYKLSLIHIYTKLIYTIPNFQNPSGITTSLKKRQEILRLAEKYGVMVMEDNPYGDLRFSGEAVPSIKSMDKNGHVVYVGSFSKILAPGLRVAFAVAPKPLIAKMTVGKQCADVHTTILTQMICERFLATCDLTAHIQKISDIYRKKCQLMIDCIDREFSPKVTHTNPEGGLFLWCTLPEGADMLDFCQRAVQAKVAVVPGVAFLADETTPCRSFRMNFSTPTDENIIKGVSILGKLTKELY